MGDVTIMVQVPSLAGFPTLGETGLLAQTGDAFEAVLADTAEARVTKETAQDGTSLPLPLKGATLAHPLCDSPELNGLITSPDLADAGAIRGNVPQARAIDKDAQNGLTITVGAANEAPLLDLAAACVDLSMADQPVKRIADMSDASMVPPAPVAVTQKAPQAGSNPAQDMAYAALWQFKLAQVPQVVLMSGPATVSAISLPVAAAPMTGEEEIPQEEVQVLQGTALPEPVPGSVLHQGVAPPAPVKVETEFRAPGGGAVSQTSAYAALWQFNAAQPLPETAVSPPVSDADLAEPSLLVPPFTAAPQAKAAVAPSGDMLAAVPPDLAADTPAHQVPPQPHIQHGAATTAEPKLPLPDLTPPSQPIETALIRTRIALPAAEALTQMTPVDSFNLLHLAVADPQLASVSLPSGPTTAGLSAFDVGTSLQTALSGQNLDRVFQVAEVLAVNDPANDIVELRLDPEELGKLRIALRSEGDLMQVSVTAERPETLDLLRRHSDRLMQELQAAGYDGATLDFGHWQSGAERDAKPNTEPSLPDGANVVRVAVTADPRPIYQSGSGLNLRL